MASQAFLEAGLRDELRGFYTILKGFVKEGSIFIETVDERKKATKVYLVANSKNKPVGFVLES